MSAAPEYCQCPHECKGCTLYPAWGDGCHQLRQKDDAGLPPDLQRCRWCAPLRDEEVKRKRKAGKGKGSESSGQISMGQVEFILGVFRKDIDELRARVMELEAARMFS